MSCPNSTAPIDISLASITGNCDYKCAYSFFYNNSSCIVKNHGDYLRIDYDKSSTPPAVYNAAGYDVDHIRIYTPSLHSYSGTKTDGEMIIIHNSNTGANPLLVCIPIKSNNNSSNSALFLKTLIDTVGTSAPAQGELTSVNIPRFNLNELVPHKPFFSYTATLPYQPCDSKVEYVVFDPLNAYLSIMSESLDKLYNVINSNPYDVKTGPNLFYNEKGPGSGGALGNEIYIDCQPVGSSSETEQIVTDVGGSLPFSIGDWMKNPWVQLVLTALLFIAILFGVKKMLGLIQPSKGGGVSVSGSVSSSVSG